jgi:hypothetical protein
MRPHQLLEDCTRRAEGHTRQLAQHTDTGVEGSETLKKLHVTKNHKLHFNYLFPTSLDISFLLR